MDFTIPEELRMLQTAVRRFVQEELMPVERAYMGQEWVPEEEFAQLRRRSMDLGFWALGAPKELGGGGVSLLGQFLVHEESSKVVLSHKETADPIFGGNPEPILLACAEDDYQRENYLLPTIRGEKHPAFAQTEPNAGSDPASMESRAVREGDDYVINGTKIFIGRGYSADFFLVLAKTDKSQGRAGVTCFLVDRNTPGFRVVREIPMMDPRRPCELSFVDVRVPLRNRIGEEGEGFQLGQRNLGRGRMGFGPRAVGRGERALDMAIRHAKQRVTFGRPIAERQAIQWMLADSAVELHACRLMYYHGAWKAEQGLDIRQEASMVKLYASEMSGRVIDRAVQIHGAYGLSKDLILEKMYRYARHERIGEGTAEIHRFVIARNLLRD